MRDLLADELPSSPVSLDWMSDQQIVSSSKFASTLNVFYSTTTSLPAH